MIKSAVTIALVPQIKKGPWIFWDDLEKSMQQAAVLGFDAIELFTPDAGSIEPDRLLSLLRQYDLTLAAVGTGAGKVVHGLTLTDPDERIREKAVEFISNMMTFSASFGAPAIIGSMQGNITPGIDSQQVMNWLAEGLKQLDQLAGELGTQLIYEPLNRYETNLINTIPDAASFLQANELSHTRLLADLFHMNIEEINIAESIKNNMSHIGHVHFADSNRNPVGFGHTDLKPIAAALKDGGYDGFVSAEAFPWPTSDEAAAQTIRAFREYFR